MAALDRMTLSIKLSMYVTKRRGIMARSIFFTTLRATMASCAVSA